MIIFYFITFSPVCFASWISLTPLAVVIIGGPENDRKEIGII